MGATTLVATLWRRGGDRLTNIQRIIDALSDALSRPTAVDDANFRLLFYSPQRGPLDQVRVESILHRDAPAAAKDWVRALGVEHAVGVHRLGGAPDVGLLPRTYVAIRHEGTLLGFLWIIDADETLSSAFDDRIEAAARELGPLLYRRRTLDLLDRRREREAVRGLFGEDEAERGRSAARLEDSGVLMAGTRPCVLVVQALVAAGNAFHDTERLAMEASLERLRGRVPDTDIVHASDGPRGVLVVAQRDTTATGLDPRVFGQQLADDCCRRLPGRRVVVGIGSTRDRLTEAHRSYAEALSTTRMLARVASLGDVLAHDDLGVYATIARLPASALTADLIPPEVRALLQEDEDGNLTTTVEAFLDAAGDVARVAGQLHLHRSTVYARLRRAENVTQCSLSDGHTRLVIHLGLAVARTVGLWPRMAN